MMPGRDNAGLCPPMTLRAPSYSITLSARVKIDSGTVRPSAFAVFRLIASSNLLGCTTGKKGGPHSAWVRAFLDVSHDALGSRTVRVH
jgi:hypothetical protein